jgi:hypothetical protein
MSESGQTVVVAQIYVTGAGDPPTVDCTQKVKSGLGLVIWQVHNNSGSDLTNVQLTNFTPSDTNIQAVELRSGAPSDLSTGPIPNGHRRTVPAVFRGRPGDVYTYDIEVNGRVANDPQLEI